MGEGHYNSTLHSVQSSPLTGCPLQKTHYTNTPGAVYIFRQGTRAFVREWYKCAYLGQDRSARGPLTMLPQPRPPRRRLPGSRKGAPKERWASSSSWMIFSSPFSCFSFLFSNFTRNSRNPGEKNTTVVDETYLQRKKPASTLVYVTRLIVCDRYYYA